jgi:hypothetical protein
MDATEKAAWVTGLLGLLGVISKIISDRLSPGLSAIVGPELADDRELKKLVRNIFPRCTTKHVELKKTNSGLFRAEVRHVIFRRDTVCQIISRVAGDTLFTLAKEIGQSAATDLFNQVRNAINKRYIKKDFCLKPGAILALLSFWDHTGGWGNYHLIHSKTDEKIWTIRVDNDFLSKEDGFEFWRGYFWGFCDICIHQLIEITQEYKYALPDALPYKLEIGSVKDVACMRQGDGFLCEINFISK